MEDRESSHPSTMLQVDLTCEGHLIAEPLRINQEMIRHKRIYTAKQCKVL